jgi:hypothetical protein
MRDEVKVVSLLSNIDKDTATPAETSALETVEGAKRISIITSRANHTSGSSTVLVEVSVDGTTWVQFNRLVDNIANDDTETKAHIASKAYSSNGTYILGLDLTDFVFKYLRVNCQVATDGDSDVSVAYEI